MSVRDKMLSIYDNHYLNVKKIASHIEYNDTLHYVSSFFIVSFIIEAML